MTWPPRTGGAADRLSARASSVYDALDVSAYLRFVAKVKGCVRAAIPVELER